MTLERQQNSVNTDEFKPITSLTEIFVSPQGDVLTYISQAIRAIHTGEAAVTTPFYNVRPESVIGSLKEGSVILIATTIEHDQQIPIGYALLSAAIPDTTNCREVSVLLSHQYRGKGLATILFTTLLNKARSLGITKCCATFSTENSGVWKLLLRAKKAELITYKSAINGPETTVQIELL